MNSSKITIPLDIPDVTVVSIQQDELGEWHITVENQNNMTICGVCGEEIECKHGRGRKLKFRHLPILGKATYIYIVPKRGKCGECPNTPTTTQTTQWYKSHSPHTKAYDKYLVCQLKGSTVIDVSSMEQIGYDAILGALKREVEVDIKWDEIEELGTIGIDEVSTRKGKKSYRAVLTARQANGQKHILAVLPDRKKKTVKAFLETIPKRLRITIHSFTTDMWGGYITAIEEYIDEHPDVKAELVIDRFHVAQNYREGFDKLRKKVMRRLKKELSQEDYNAIVKGMHWPLRYNHGRLTKESRKRLRKLFKFAPQLHVAYSLREELTAIFNSKLSRKKAEKRFKKWIEKARATDSHCYDSFIKTLTNHFDGILNYFNRRVNSGFVEGINNKLKSLTRRCFGISTLDTLTRRLRLDMADYASFS